MRYILVGNYGTDNIGDELLRAYMTSTFSEHAWQTVSAKKNSEDLPRLPFGVRSIFRPWWKTLYAIIRSDGIVYGGGSLFTDVESMKAPVMWWMYAVWAWLFRRRILLAFQGIGPFRSRIGRFFATWVLRRAHHISVRDEASLERVQILAPSALPVLTFDPALEIFERTERKPSGKTLLLIPRSNSTDAFLDAATKAMSGDWDTISVLLMQPTEQDRKYARRLKSVANHQSVHIHEPHTVEGFLDVVTEASFILSQRYHGALAALALGVPYEVIPQLGGDKLSTLADKPDLPSLREKLRQGAEALSVSLR